MLFLFNIINHTLQEKLHNKMPKIYRLLSFNAHSSLHHANSLAQFLFSGSRSSLYKSIMAICSLSQANSGKKPGKRGWCCFFSSNISQSSVGIILYLTRRCAWSNNLSLYFPICTLHSISFCTDILAS